MACNHPDISATTTSQHHDKNSANSTQRHDLGALRRPQDYLEQPRAPQQPPGHLSHHDISTTTTKIRPNDMTWGSSGVLRTTWNSPGHRSSHDMNGMQPRSSLDTMPPMTDNRYLATCTRNFCTSRIYFSTSLPIPGFTQGPPKISKKFSPVVLHRGFLSIVTFSAKSQPSQSLRPLRRPMRVIRQPPTTPDQMHPSQPSISADPSGTRCAGRAFPLFLRTPPTTQASATTPQGQIMDIRFILLPELDGLGVGMLLLPRRELPVLLGHDRLHPHHRCIDVLVGWHRRPTDMRGAPVILVQLHVEPSAAVPNLGEHAVATASPTQLRVRRAQGKGGQEVVLTLRRDRRQVLVLTTATARPVVPGKNISHQHISVQDSCPLTEPPGAGWQRQEQQVAS